MKAFFEGMNFVRAVMLLCFVAAAVLGYLVREGRAEVVELRDQVNRQAPLLVNEIQNQAVLLDQLRKVASGSEFEAISNPNSYLLSISTDNLVAIGDLNFDPGRVKSNAPGTEDRILGFAPTDRKRSFRRANISNLFYSIEQKSPFAIVTKFSMRLIKKTKPNEHPADAWSFDGDMTIRQPVESR